MRISDWGSDVCPSDREGVEFASELTLQQNLAQVPAARAFAMAEMIKAGVKFYVPTDDELQQWVDAAGAHRAEWDGIKKELVGSLSALKRVVEGKRVSGRVDCGGARIMNKQKQ